MNRNKQCKVMSVLLSASMMVGFASPTISLAAESYEDVLDDIVGLANPDLNQEESVELRIAKNHKLDVVLTVGSTMLNGINFDKDLKASLESKDVDTSNLNITAIETTNVNVQDSFDWDYHGHDITDGWPPRDGKRISVSDEGQSLYFDGYMTKGYADFMYLEDDNPGKKTFSFKMNEGVIDYHAMEGAGFLFNTEIKNDRIRGYAIIIGPEIRLYEIDTTLNNFKNSSTKTLGEKSKLIKSFARNSGKNHDVVIEADNRTLNMTDSGRTIIDNYKLPTDMKAYGFGPIASHSSHNCDVRSNFKFEDLSMEMETVKKFEEVIREPEWNKNSQRYVVNLNDSEVSDFDDKSASGAILTRLINERIHYIGVGQEESESQALRLVGRNNGNGAFYNSSNYDIVIDNVAEYIKADLSSQDNSDENNAYILENQPFTVTSSDAPLKNSQDEEFTLGKWRIDHDHNYYENSNGQADWANQWQKDFKMDSGKVGKYEVFYGNKNTTPKYIYIHRKPTADYALSTVKDNDKYRIETIDYSYDLDNASKPNKGIVEHEWKWRETLSQEWNDGKLPADLPFGNHYITQLRVKDEQGVWSDPESRYITSDNEISVLPIASFDIALDRIGNKLERTAGEYVIDKTAPVLNVVNNNNGVDGEFEEFNVSAIDNMTGLNRVCYEYNGNTVVSEGPTMKLTRNGTYEFFAEDNVGNVSKGTTIEVTKAASSEAQIDHAEKAVVRAEQNNVEVNYQDALNKVNSLTPSEAKEGLMSRLNKITEAVTAVEKAESTKIQVDIEDAKALVSQLTNGITKTRLNTRLDNIQSMINKENDLLDAAIKAVEKAESTENKFDITIAYVSTNKLNQGADKDGLITRLDDLQKRTDNKRALIEANKAVEKAERTEKELDINDAYSLVSDLVESPNKQDLLNRLQAINDKKQAEIEKQNMLLDEAAKSVEKAESTITQSDVNVAKDKVVKLPNNSDKKDLLDRLDVVQEKINYNILINETTKSVDKAEATENQFDINSAYRAIDKLNNGDVKDELTNRLKALEGKIKEDNENMRLEAEAKKAVNKAEKSKNDDDIEDARNKVTKVKDSVVKQDLNDRLDNIEKEKEAKVEEGKIKDAERLVRVAEIFKIKANLIEARNAVESLKKGPDKNKLVIRLDALDDYQSKLEKDLLDKAEASVIRAEKHTFVTLIKAAQDAVNELSQGENRNSLQIRIDALRK